MRVKKIPMRMCLGCQEMKSKKELIRVVRTPENTIEIDSGGKRAGRGAYVCLEEKCITKAIKTKRLEKAFGQPVPLEIADKIRERLVT
jgi:predicted RNA-binding protein YlxR (DUF448 family)